MCGMRYDTNISYIVYTFQHDCLVTIYFTGINDDRWESIILPLIYQSLFWIQNSCDALFGTRWCEYQVAQRCRATIPHSTADEPFIVSCKLINGAVWARWAFPRPKAVKMFTSKERRYATLHLQGSFLVWARPMRECVTSQRLMSLTECIPEWSPDTERVLSGWDGSYERQTS